MDDYISRPYIMGKLTAADAQKAVREMSGDEAYNWFLELVGFAPAADVEPVRHGRWIGLEYDGYADGNPVYDLWECSECGEEVRGESVPETHLFCHNCGAKMDGGAEDAV